MIDFDRPSPKQTLHIIGIILILLIAIPLVAFAATNYIGGVGSYYVVSNSMSPMINAGDAVFVRETPAESIQAGDVITYHPPGGGPITTHQVIEVVHQDGTPQFQTKGLANEEPDPYRVPPEAVIGKVVLHVPYLGVFILLAGTREGLILLVIVPSALLIINEIVGLIQAARHGNTPTDGDTTEKPE